MSYISYKYSGSHYIPVIIYVNPIMCMYYTIVCHTDKHIHIYCYQSHFSDRGVLLCVFSTYYLKYEEVKWEFILSYVSMNLVGVFHNNLSRALVFILRYLLFDPPTPCWVNCWYIYLNMYFLVLYNGRISHYVRITKGLCTTLN